ncbi:PREDICTED: phenolic glucoside malonyltransferase 2-like [Tarenaya hassleriana]|uniref:phenolic glucoside malonyltransferase 2-like n=1 Tax=Tarenaya hassleriana TaxID=28532 RepID=UPI00053C0FF9|nr:PREDICTED: phenolic glucoside malonyltransferase 2-like [Tarenaya hassleriana]
MALKVTEIARVRPATDSVLSRSTVDSVSLHLTFFDLMWIRFHPVERVFFYRLTELTRESFDSVVLPKLKRSLSLVLLHYIPLAGRITWDPQESKPSIVASRNDAVSVTVAETDADFDHLSGDEQRQETEVRELVPELPASDDSASVVSLQITLFPNQGFCIGMTAHHSVLDGKTASMFIKSWAHICNRERGSEVFDSLPDDLSPCFDRTVIKYPTGLDTKMLELLSSILKDKSKARSLKPLPGREISSEVVRVTLELTREDIEKLRERVKNESSSQDYYHLSTFVVTYAYVWTCMVKARGGGADTSACLGFVADFRDRLNPPSPATYFGSCVFPVGCYDANTGAFSEENGFITAVKILSDLVKRLGSRGIEEIFEEMVEGARRLKPDTKLGSVAGSTRLGFYGSDFGWGKPVKVEVVSIDQNGAFSLAERRDETGGVEIGLCLEKSEMEKLVSFFRNGLTPK